MNKKEEMEGESSEKGEAGKHGATSASSSMYSSVADNENGEDDDVEDEGNKEGNVDDVTKSNGESSNSDDSELDQQTVKPAVNGKISQMEKMSHLPLYVIDSAPISFRCLGHSRQLPRESV